MGQLGVGVAMKLKDVRRPVPVAERVGVDFPRYFTAKLESGKTPYDEVAWELRTASIGNDKGAVIFEQRDVEVPADWSQTATNIVVSKYFYGKTGSPERETSVRQLVGRVVDTIADWGVRPALLPHAVQDAANFRDELAHLMLTQKACFNSPVWFNVGVKEPRGYGWYYDEATRRRSKKLDAGRAAAAVLGVLHQFGGRYARIDSRSGEDRRHAVQVGLGHGHESFDAARRRRVAFERRARFRSAELHEGLRRLRGRDQERRQDAARGEDGDPQRRPSRYRRIHLVQGQGREEGPHADRRGLRFVARRRRLRLHLLPERQQQRARHRRIHGSGDQRRRLVDQVAPRRISR